MWRLAYRNFGSRQVLVGNFVTDVNGNDRAGVRWFELRKTGSAWSLYQQGTYAPGTLNRWMGAIAMDRSGNIALGYNVVQTASPIRASATPAAWPLMRWARFRRASTRLSTARPATVATATATTRP